MNTVDITKVAGFNAVDAEGNSLGILSKEDLIEAVKLSLIDDIQAAKTAALADVDMLASDVTEDQLPTDDNPAQIRTLATNGDPKRTSMQALAKVVEGLVGVATTNNNGLMSAEMYKSRFQSTSIPGGKVLQFNIPRYTRDVLKVLLIGAQNTVAFNEAAFIVDMNTGKPKAYNTAGVEIKYKTENQQAIIYIKSFPSAETRVFFQNAGFFPSSFNFNYSIIDSFPSDAINLNI